MVETICRRMWTPNLTMEVTMTPTKLMWYYKQNKSLAARDIGCSRATISNWIKAKKIPKHWQALIALYWELDEKK